MSIESRRLRVLVADDEAIARRQLRHLLTGRSVIGEVVECGTADDTVQLIRDFAPDLVFLDMRMPGRTGLEGLRDLTDAERPVVVMVTAHPDHALEAFAAFVDAYLLKPYSTSQFETVLDHAVRRVAERAAHELVGTLRAYLEQEAPPAPTSSVHALPDRLVVRERERTYYIEVDSVHWVEADGSHVRLHAANGVTHRIRGRIADLEQRLDPRRFVRVHRSAIVRIDQVRELEPYFHGDYILHLKSGAHVRLSRRRTEAFERLGLL